MVGKIADPLGLFQGSNLDGDIELLTQGASLVPLLADCHFEKPALDIMVFCQSGACSVEKISENGS